MKGWRGGEERKFEGKRRHMVEALNCTDTTSWAARLPAGSSEGGTGLEGGNWDGGRRVAER